MGGKKSSIQFGDEHSGIRIEYDKKRKVISVHGWYDGGFGHIEGGEVKIDEFLGELGIKDWGLHPLQPHTPHTSRPPQKPTPA